MRFTSFPLAVLTASLVFPAVGRGGFIDLSSSTKLNADVNASLTRSGDKVADSHESHDVGSLSKTSAAASASASLPIDAESESVTTGAAKASLSGSDDMFHLSGSAASDLPVNCPFDALTQSVSTASAEFALAPGGSARLDYVLNIDAMVTRDEKVTLVLTQAGESSAIFSHVFTDTATGTLSLSDAGSYHLLLIAGAHSTTKGVAGESGTAAFDVALSAAPAASTSIPLPSALGPGAIALAGLAVLSARRRLRLPT